MRNFAHLSVPCNGRLAVAAYVAYFPLTIGAEALVGHVQPVVGAIANVVATLCYAVLVVLLYGVFIEVGPTRSGIAAAVGVAGCVATMLARFHVLPVPPHPLLYFAPYCVLIAYLIVTSPFVPRAVGALVIIAGVAWVAVAAGFLPPPAAKVAEVLGIVALGALIVWLVAVGNHLSRWDDPFDETPGDAPSMADEGAR